MRLFVLRHGKAKDGSPDELRELRSRGRKDVEWVLNSKLDELKTVSQLQFSPLVRAKQTAEIAAKVVGCQGSIAENGQLTPWAKPIDFLRTVDEKKGDLLVASHQPFVSDLVTVLTGKDIWMPTASLVCLEAEYMTPGNAELLWQQEPNR